ncbi:MAG: methyl-accepting chemotaxis protein, partial [Spirochaetota bacterium]
MRLFRPLAFAAAVLALLALGSGILHFEILMYSMSGLAAVAAFSAGFSAPRRLASPVEAEVLAAMPGQAVSAEPDFPAFDAAVAEFEAVPASVLPDLSAINDARRRLAFAKSIASSVPQKTEEAAFGLIERFESMRGNTSRAATSARDFKKSLTGGLGSGRASVAEQAEKTRDVIKAQRDAIAALTSHNKQGAKELRSMGKELESGLDLLKGIEEITERSRLIAFNMAVEAARIGEKGRGFRVIVGELRNLNDRTADFSRQVIELLGRFRDFNATIVAGLAEETEQVAHQVQGGMDASEGAVESLIEASKSADSFAR